MYVTSAAKTSKLVKTKSLTSVFTIPFMSFAPRNAMRLSVRSMKQKCEKRI